jgi:hypothetical protein
LSLEQAFRAEWRAWRARVQERYGEMDLLTVMTGPPAVAVFFQRRSGAWLDAGLIDELLLLTRSSGEWGRTRRRRQSAARARTGQVLDNGVSAMQADAPSHCKSENGTIHAEAQHGCV